jgi:hypothetical protein
LWTAQGRCGEIGHSQWLKLTGAAILVSRGVKFLQAAPAAYPYRYASKDNPCMLTWDRSHDYVLHRFWNDLTRITIRFRNAPPSVGELAALRRCLPQFRDVRPAMLRSRVGDCRQLSLGEMPTRAARSVIETAQAQGLEVVAESASFVSYLPFDRTTGCAWLIEDDAEAAAVVQGMLEEGVPVQDIEA